MKLSVIFIAILSFYILKSKGDYTKCKLKTTSMPITATACALWTRFNNDNGPSVNGFSAGISYLSNTNLYVGMGMYKNDRLPARIQTKTSTVGSSPMTAGGYVPSTSEVQVPFTEYLVVPDGCTCSWMAPSQALLHSGLILTGEPKYGYAVGRKTFKDGRVGLTSVPTFKTLTSYLKQCYNPTPNTADCTEYATELLVCETNGSTAGRPKVTFNTESCAMWSTIGMVSSASINGFSAGISIVNNNTAYVGRGQAGNRFFPGRYQNTAVAGTYALYLNMESLVDYGSQWLIVPQNCSCSWKSPQSANARIGLVTVPDELYNFMIGRKTFASGQVAITKVNFKNPTILPYFQWYLNETNAMIAEPAAEVLVCATS